jgi:hypothetical protein
MFDLSDSQWGIWGKLLCLANQQSERGLIVIRNKVKPAISTLASLLYTRSDRLATALQLFSDKNMVKYELNGKEGWLLITNWNKRQFQSDDVTSRTLKHYHTKRSIERLRTEQNREKKKHPSKDVSSSSISFLDRKGGDFEKEVPHEALPLSKSTNTADEKAAFREKDANTDKPTQQSVMQLAVRLAQEHSCDELIDTVKDKIYEDGIELEIIDQALIRAAVFYEPREGITFIKRFQESIEIIRKRYAS